MKNMKKLLQRAMVFTLSAAMLVGTPMTASAAGLVDLYSISDGTSKGGDYDETTNPTGTVTNTDTNTTTTVLAENEARIIGISLDETDLTVEVGAPEKDRQKIKATVIMDWGENAPSDDDKEEIMEALNSKIKWEVLNPDETKSDPLPATILAIDASAADRTVVTLNPKKGNKEKMIVRASIDGRYVWKAKRNPDGSLMKDENGKTVFEETKTELEVTKDVLFKADAKVFVKEYTNELWFDWDRDGVKDLTDTYEGNAGDHIAYLKHTEDLNKYLRRDPATANDTITWVSSNTKAATVTAAGVVTFKKKDESGSIIAISERGKKIEWKFKVDPGVAASKVEIVKSNGETFTKNKTEVDLNYQDTTGRADGWSDTSKENENSTLSVKVNMYAKVKAYTTKTNGKDEAIVPVEEVGASVSPDGTLKNVEIKDGAKYIGDDQKVHQLKITDVIDWTSNKTAFAYVASDEGTDETTTTNTVTATNVGKASITAKASNGKKASLAVTVKATLGALTIDEVKDNTLYSGQNVTLTYTPDPRASKDAVKWSVVAYDKEGEPLRKSPAKITAKGVLTINPDVTGCDNIVVRLESKKIGKSHENGEDKTISTEKPFTIKQSSIDGIHVTDDSETVVANVYTVYNESNGKATIKKNQLEDKKNNTTTINAEKGRTYAVTVDLGKYPEEAEEGSKYGDASTLSWKTSKATVADIKNNGSTVLITAHQKGSATITVSGVRVDEKGKAKAISTTFKVNVNQPVKTLTMNKSSVVLNQKIKNQKVNGEMKPVTQSQKVALKATLGPKGVDNKTAVTWTVWKDGELLSNESVGLVNKGVPVTKASVSINLPEPAVGDEFKITASTASGASATTTVTVVKNTAEVAIADASKTKVAENDTVAKDDLERFTTTNKTKTVVDTAELKIGENLKMMPVINIGDAEKKKDGKPNWVVAGTNDAEQVTYTVNKKGIVNIDADGNVYAVNSGTVTITAKTPLNKKATLKITVAKPEPENPTVSGNSTN